MHFVCLYSGAMRGRVLAGAALLAMFSAQKAQAVCVYHGVYYAKPTLGQEYHDSKWVVRARVVSARYHYSEADDDSWVIYRIEVLQRFKQTPLTHLMFFTFRNSGGFYLDDGMSHHVGGDYLLFLNSNERSNNEPTALKGTVSVNYSCGQSREWQKVSASDLEALTRLSKLY